MKLKTLKEIGQSKRKCCSIEEDYSNICEKCLKKEAIKWVKNCRCNRQGQICQGCIRFRVFFNIKEEDLK